MAPTQQRGTANAATGGGDRVARILAGDTGREAGLTAGEVTGAPPTGDAAWEGVLGREAPKGA